MTKTINWNSPVWQKRQAIWRHNGFLGSAAMMKKQCAGIINSQTATAKSKDLAEKILSLAIALEESLKERRK